MLCVKFFVKLWLFPNFAYLHWHKKYWDNCNIWYSNFLSLYSANTLKILARIAMRSKNIRYFLYFMSLWTHNSNITMSHSALLDLKWLLCQIGTTCRTSPPHFYWHLFKFLITNFNTMTPLSDVCAPSKVYELNKMHTKV